MADKDAVRILVKPDSGAVGYACRRCEDVFEGEPKYLGRVMYCEEDHIGDHSSYCEVPSTMEALWEQTFDAWECANGCIMDKNDFEVKPMSELDEGHFAWLCLKDKIQYSEEEYGAELAEKYAKGCCP